MNAKIIMCISILAVMPHVGARAGARDTCSREAAIAAETQATPKTWADLYKSFRSFHQCDDGAVAEVFSDAVAILLADHWETIRDLNALVKAHPSFGKFVLRHTDVTMSLDQAQTLKGNARDKCPASTRQLCERILRRMREFK